MNGASLPFRSAVTSSSSEDEWVKRCSRASSCRRVGQTIERTPLHYKLALQRGVSGQSRDEEMWGGHQGTNTFRVQAAKRIEGLCHRGTAVVDAGNDVIVQVDEGG